MSNTLDLNTTALSAVLQETGFLIAAHEFHLWRPTKREPGYIQGIDLGLTILATNGSLGLFTIKDKPSYFLGHIEHFSGKVEPLFSAPPKLQPNSIPQSAVRRLPVGQRLRLRDLLS